MKRKLTAMVLAAVMAVTSLFTGTVPVDAATVKWEKSTIPVIKNADEFQNVDGLYSQHVELYDRTDEVVKGYTSFTLKENSWVILSVNASMVESKDDGHKTTVEVFSDKTGVHRVMSLEDIYVSDDAITYGFLNKGTYYVYVQTLRANYGSFVGNVNVVGAAIPQKNLIQPKVKLNKSKTKATVSFENNMGIYIEGVQYQKGNIGKAHDYDNAYWWKLVLGSWEKYSVKKGYNPKLLTQKGDKYSFTVNKNGKYTILVRDKEGNRCSKVVTVKGIKTSKKK